VILETSAWVGLKKDDQDIHYSDIMGIDLKKNVFSSDVIIKSRFQGEVHMNTIGHKDAEHIEQIINQGINRYRYGYGGAPEPKRNE
jgi:hypothetical protein